MFSTFIFKSAVNKSSRIQSNIQKGPREHSEVIIHFFKFFCQQAERIFCIAGNYMKLFEVSQNFSKLKFLPVCFYLLLEIKETKFFIKANRKIKNVSNNFGVFSWTFLNIWLHPGWFINCRFGNKCTE